MIKVAADNLTLYSDVLPPLSLRIGYIEDPKEYDKFVKNCTVLVRRSYEYQLWTKYIKQTLGHKTCALTGEVQDDVTIELHHHPLCLQDICDIVISTMVVNGKEFCTFDITTAVIELHFQNNVGYIPLCKTLHEKYHSGALNIPIQLVHGNWQFILDNFHVSDHYRAKVDKLAAITTTNHKGWKKDEYSCHQD